MPEIEVEADSFEEAQAIVLPQIESIWARYCEPGRELRTFGNREKLTAFAGGEIYFDKENHVYTNEAGEVYLSGSQYAKSFEQPFNAEVVSAAVAKKSGSDPREIQEMWELKGSVSRDFGSAIHAALELYGRFKGLSEALGKDYHIHNHPVIKLAVEKFYAEHRGTYGHELLVVDHTSKRAGRIDILETVEDGVIVGDFKTNADIDKALPTYKKQLEFYGGILEANGYRISGYQIHHWNGEWNTIDF